jgi:hypothetical protein
MIDDDETPSPAAMEADEAIGLDQTADEAVATDSAQAEDRIWMRTLASFLINRPHEEEGSHALRAASELAAIAAYDRICRIARRDDPIE